eukprot:6196788-Pleurochrysis_carterae.AAC.1
MYGTATLDQFQRVALVGAYTLQLRLRRRGDRYSAVLRVNDGAPTLRTLLSPSQPVYFSRHNDNDAFAYSIVVRAHFFDTFTLCQTSCSLRAACRRRSAGDGYLRPSDLEWEYSLCFQIHGACSGKTRISTQSITCLVFQEPVYFFVFAWSLVGVQPVRPALTELCRATRGS